MPYIEGRRLTKAERSEAERERQKALTAKRQQEAKIRRLLMLGAGSGVTALLVLFLLTRGSTTLVAPTIIPTPAVVRKEVTPTLHPEARTQVAATAVSVDAIFEEELKRLGVVFNPEEDRILSKYSYQPGVTPLPANPVTGQLAVSRVINTLNFLGESKNPVFNDAHRILQPLSRDGRLQFHIYDTLSSGLGSQNFPLQSTYLLVGNRIVYPVEVSAYDVNNSVDTVLLGFGLTYISEMIGGVEEMNLRYSAVPGLQRLEIINREFAKQELTVSQEAKAYARYSEAYLWETGLLGRRNKGSADEDSALRYIQLRGRFNSKEWVAYVQRELMAPQLGTPPAKTPRPRMFEYPLLES